MVCFTFILILISAFVTLSDEVKVDLRGSLTLGKDVVSALKSFVDVQKLNGRRSFGDNGDGPYDQEKDTVTLLVHSSFLCRENEFCKGFRGRLLHQYIISITKSIENIFESLMKDTDKPTVSDKNGSNTLVFEKELKKLLREIKNMLKTVNEKATDDNRTRMWLEVLKRINAKFQDAAISFLDHSLEGNVDEITVVKKKVIQTIIVTTTSIELKFETKFCNLYNTCSKSHQVTEALNSLLKQLSAVTEDETKEFIRVFYETLPGTNFYYRISEVTGHEFQMILHDMVYSNTIPPKTILANIQRIVEGRLNAVTTNKERRDEPDRKDLKLIHVMLSDMDHFYSKYKEPFFGFMKDFYDWTKMGGKFNSKMRHVMKDLQNNLSNEADELVFKLVNEMRVFLEVTIDPN